MAASNYGALYAQAAQQYDLPPALLPAVAQVESSGNPNAVSDQGAIGLMQLEPGTAKGLGVANPRDPRQAIFGAAKLLRQNLDAAGGNLTTALKMYHGGTDPKNWGPLTNAYPEQVQAKMTTPTNASPGADAGAAAWQQFAAQYGIDSAPQAAAPAGPGAAIPTNPGAPSASAASRPAASAWDQFAQAHGLDGAQAPGGVQSAQQIDASPVDRFMVGVGHGATTVLESAKELGLEGLQKLGWVPQSVVDNYRHQVADENALYQSTKPTTGMKVGDFTGQVAAQVPVFELGGGVLGAAGDGAGNLLTRAGPVGRAAVTGLKLLTGAGVDGAPGVALRAAAGGVRGALAGGTSAALTAAQNPSESLGEQVRQGAEVGGALGGVVGPVLGAGGRALKNALVGPPLDPETALLAQKAGQMGVPLGGAEISGSTPMHYAKATLDQIPFTGAAARDAAQQSGFNRAVASQIGVDATKLTPAVMSQARDRLGQQFDAIAARNPVKVDNQLLNDLADIDHQASAEMPESAFRPIQKNLDDVIAAGQSGTLTGAQYQALTRKGTPLWRAMNSPDPNVAHFAGQIRDALDNALERSASPEDLQLLQQARGQWKALKTVEPLVEKSPSGNVSPAALMSQVRQHYGGMAYNGAGDMGDLARIGQAFLKEPPNSGTAPRAMWTNLLTGGALGAGGLGLADPAALGSIAATGGKALLALPALRATSAAINSGAYRNLLINRALDTYPAWQRAVGAGATALDNALVRPGLVPAALAVSLPHTTPEPVGPLRAMSH
ncbi:lytic transglycosylase domain-containing protein [Ferrovum sp.]|uniref:lytic transglycosylase domain-containing protein n=1 Tax=Ferrovum sp. TaxID=2609467 RepID=UPI002632698C|nr:transglycosylase SLT domain-containing protein [Ferrovum sp.]